MSVTISLESTGKLGKRKRNITFVVPESLVRGSILEDALDDHDDDDDEVVFPVPYESGVVIRALVDCLMIHRRLDSAEPRKGVLYSVYRWRRRMGELIRCCSYLGFAEIQELCDESMRERSSIGAWERDIGVMLKKASFVPSELVAFFEDKLDYDRIHEHQLSQWIGQCVMDRWWHDAIFETKVFLYRRLRELLNWDGLGVYGRVTSDRKVYDSYRYYAKSVLGRYFYVNGYTAASVRHELLKEFLDFDVDLLRGQNYFNAADMSRFFSLLQTVSESVQGRILDNIALSTSGAMISRLQSHVLTDQFWRDLLSGEGTKASLSEYVVGENAMAEGANVAAHVSESTNVLIAKVAKALRCREDIFRCVFAYSF